jgi:hypothetical protein
METISAGHRRTRQLSAPFSRQLVIIRTFWFIQHWDSRAQEQKGLGNFIKLTVLKGTVTEDFIALFSITNTTRSSQG